MSKLVAKLVAMVGGIMILMRRWGADTELPAVGGSPQIPDAKAQSIPTLKMPTAKGWQNGHTPTAAPGLRVNLFADDLIHPRWITVLPNNDVLVAEALQAAWPVKSAFDYAILSTMKRAAAVGDSANRIMLFRDNDQDGIAEERHEFLSNLNRPFGMSLINDTFYVGNTDGVMKFAYESGSTSIHSDGEYIASFKPDGHWTRSLLPNKEGTKLFAGVGSMTNIADDGFEIEADRAAIHQIDLKTGEQSLFATGLRNPVGMAWEPTTDTLWTVVNERDGLGDEVPPDYLTSVTEGGFYGWPYCYWGQTIDDRVEPDMTLVASAIKPDYALGGHTASLGLCWMPAGTLSGFDRDGMVIGQHGSWNRSNLSGYAVIYVPFENGKPAGPPQDILTGFLSNDEKHSYGRPVGVTLGPNNSLLVADDVGNVIWRVTSDR